ncbi:MAG TPA: prepilin-type N-terminal cleavage/methylation domain-containing protein [Thermoanaerobaculia bacterium]
MSSQRGLSLLELLTCVAIIAVIGLSSFPSWMSLRRRSAVRIAASELRAIFQQTRARALARSINCGVKFVQLGRDWHFSIYDDGDQDGIRNDDILRGIDRPVTQPRLVFLEGSRAARIELPNETIVDPDGEKLPPTKSPVQFNKSAICSFSPIGESTPGSIYLNDGDGTTYAVRVYGATGRVRVLRYDRLRRKWEVR